MNKGQGVVDTGWVHPNPNPELSSAYLTNRSCQRCFVACLSRTSPSTTSLLATVILTRTLFFIRCISGRAIYQIGNIFHSTPSSRSFSRRANWIRARSRVPFKLDSKRKRNRNPVDVQLALDCSVLVTLLAHILRLADLVVSACRAYSRSARAVDY
jgi:hypothetical protein